MGGFFSNLQDGNNVTKNRQPVAVNTSYDHGSQCIPRPHTVFATKTGRHTGTTVNLVLLGMAGTGKSASGNTILGKKHFISRPSSTPVTTKCQNGQSEISGVHVNVIDTPDIFDDEIGSSVMAKHVKRCKELYESGPCVYVLVMHVSRFTDSERDIMEKLEKAFGREVRGQTIILFTRGNDLQQAGIGLEDFLHSCQPALKKMVEKCRDMCVLFENHKSGSDQVEKLMEKVNKIKDQKNL